MPLKELLISSVQIGGDLTCCILSMLCAARANKTYRLFFILNSIAFFSLILCDTYYNYLFRLTGHDIRHSIDLWVTATLLIFQIVQVYNWLSLIKKQKIDVFSRYNSPYLLFIVLVIFLLIYYFLIGQSVSQITTWYQIANITLDMLIWLFAIVCLVRTNSFSIMLLTLGCLMVISSDLTIRSLFMLKMTAVASSSWIHMIWAGGILVMLVGFIAYLRNQEVKFCPINSIQANSIAWISITSFIAFLTGFIFLSIFNNSFDYIDVGDTLWYLPIALMFTMIISVFLGNWFSKALLKPINYFLIRIQEFNIGEEFVKHGPVFDGIYEFKKLEEFIDSSFVKLSNQLEREIKIAAQVAHDIRSPLSSLEIIIKRLPEIEETRRILLRDAINQIRDIANNLEKDAQRNLSSNKNVITQIAVLVDYILSERRIGLSKSNIQIKHNFDISCYDLFVEVVPSIMKRILVNIINNACESLIHGEGIIEIDIFGTKDNVTIVIKDNGSGIPEENIGLIFKQGFTTKIKGTGLGLSHAKENVQQWGGDIEVASIFGGGTSMCIHLPRHENPLWFISNLTFYSEEIVVCVDDSISVWRGWQEKFNAMGNTIDLQYCKSKEELLIEIEKHQGWTTYLIDYEFTGSFYTGLDLIEIVLSIKKQKNRVFLVSSHSHDEKLQKICFEKNIYIIPKFYIPKIPIFILNEPPKNILISPLADNGDLSSSAILNKSNFLVYCNVNDCLANLPLFPLSCKIFILKDIFDDKYLRIFKEYGFEPIVIDNINYFLSI